MGTEQYHIRIKELEEALEAGNSITSDAAKILSECADILGVYSSKTAPVRNKARALTTASKNISQAREKCDQISTSLDMSRRLKGIIQRGPGEDMEAFLQAVEQLEEANKVLWANQSLNVVKDATHHSEKLWNEAMTACEEDYAVTLTNASRTFTREKLMEAVRENKIELVDVAALPRLKVLGATIMKGAHQRVTKVYVDLRLEVTKQMLNEMCIQTDSFPQLQNCTLEQLEEKINRWVEMVLVMTIIFEEEKNVIRKIFSASAVDGIFSQVVDLVMIRVASFCSDILKTAHSSHKLFSLLDMHQALESEVKKIKPIVEGTQCFARFQNIENLLRDIENASGALFDAFQSSVREDNSKIQIQDGTVHPLTAGVITYFKRLFKHNNFMKVLYGQGESGSQDSQFQIGNHMSGTMVRILVTLQDNLEVKSRGYKSKALASLFMMNNVNFIVSSVEQSKAIELLGVPWVERQKTIVEDYARQYHEITWHPVMKALDSNADDVTQSNYQRRKNAIKERFKTFNAALEDIHATQMEWTVPDPALKNKTRERILSTVIPAYTTFYDTFKDSSFTKNPDKYLKYGVQDVVKIVKEDLFENKIQSKAQRRLVL